MKVSMKNFHADHQATHTEAAQRMGFRGLLAGLKGAPGMMMCLI